MSNEEFSNEFDILYNNISSNQAPGLDEYEKSVFLTNAQDSIILEMATGKNMIGESFEKTEELRRYLTDITKTATPIQSTKTTKRISEKSTLYVCPKDLWFIVYESAKLKGVEGIVDVIPTTHDEYLRIRKNPFRKAADNKVLRLDIEGELELVSSKEIDEYTIRYIQCLEPIILEELEDLTIKGKSNKTECKLNPALHEAILERAVRLAKASMGTLESGR